MLAFAVGLLPDTLLVRLREIARSFAKTSKRTLSLVERYPLTDLEGIDIYDVRACSTRASATSKGSQTTICPR